MRGLQPFHDFSVGPDWWNLQDYESVLSQMAKLRMNFIGLHTYPSWNPAAGPEANVWIGLPEDVDEHGNVRFGYEAGVVTTRRGWAVTPFPTSRYASGAGLLFEGDDYGPDFMLDCLEWPRTAEAGAAMFNRYGDLQQQAFQQARRLGDQDLRWHGAATGGPEGAGCAAGGQRHETRGPGRNPAACTRGPSFGSCARCRLITTGSGRRKSGWGRNPGSAGGRWPPVPMSSVTLGWPRRRLSLLSAPFGFATCGWRLGTRSDALWMDKHTPRSWAASSINTRLGRDPVESAYGAMPGRSKWVIGWAEDDDAAGAHCCTSWDLQLGVERMFTNSADAFRYGCEGMMAIHWRTAAIAPNITALAQAGWDFSGASGGNASAGAWNGRFWADWGRGMFGGDAGAEAGRTLQKLDGCHPGINALIRGGASTTDEQISDFFAALRELEGLRPRITGTGNIERFGYWLNLVRASQLRVRTWVLAARLAAKMKDANAIQEADRKLGFVRQEVLPLRLDLARSYENLIAAFVDCAKSPGEVGTIASIESGSREGIVFSHDKTIAQILGEPLPAEAAVSTAYRGTPRIFVSARRTQANAGEPQEIRAFVLSGARCSGVNLYWRSLGHGSFKKLPATHRARQAYRVELPAQSRGTVEYYLEAALDDGQKVRWPATAPSINQTVVVW